MADDKEKGDLEKTSSPNENKDDEELSALLDSALEDLTSSDGNKASSQGKDSSNKKNPPVPPNTLWNEEFLKETTARFEQNMQALFSPGSDGGFSAEQLGENIQRLAEAATSAVGGDTSPDTEFSSIIAQTLKNLTQNTENLQSQFNESEMMDMLGTFSQMTDPNADPNELLPFMQHMMQSLLSKDILYPALGSIIEKYPQWLEDNRATLSSGDLERYTEQLRLMREVCAELDKETASDTAETKTARFETVLGLMQKMQDCGQPPAELAGDLGPMLALDESGAPQLPNVGQQQCSLM